MGDHHHHMAPVFPCSMPGYGPTTTTASITDAQQIQAQGKKFQLIEQPADISTEMAGKLPTHQVLAVVQAAS